MNLENLKAIIRDLDALEGIQAELATIAVRDDDRRKHDLVEMRRRLASQIAEVGRTADLLFSGINDVELTRAYRGRFSKMRTAAAMHQADWPAVLLGERVEDYQISAQRVREANRIFVEWMRETLAHLGS